MLNKNKGLNVKKLSVSQVEEIYNSYMKTDFPKDELKPLKYIKSQLEKCEYECIGLFIEDELKAYAYFVKSPDTDVMLLDYFAVISNIRGTGIGSKALDGIKRYYSNTKAILMESESPEYAKTDSERNVRERRISFYKRNGAIHTSVQTNVYGVYYDILFLKIMDDINPADEIKKIYKSMFKDFKKHYFKIIKE